MNVKRVKTDVAKNLIIALKNLESNKVGKVGWLGSAYYYPERVSVAYVATIQEYGSPKNHIPARPFFRPTIVNKKVEWGKIAEKGAKAIFAGKATVADVMEAIGLKASGDVRKMIASIFSPALAESTILNRISRNKHLSRIQGRISEKSLGSITKPLIDTGLMYGTLTNSVEDE